MLRLLFTLLKEKKGGHRIALEPGDAWFQDWLRDEPGNRELRRSDPAPDDPAIMLMSGGTTGVPKAVVGPHRCLVAAGLQLSPGCTRRKARLRTSRSCRCRSFTFTPALVCRATRSSAERRWRSCRTRATSPTSSRRSRPSGRRCSAQYRVVHRAAQPSEGQEQGSGLQLDPRLLLRRSPADGGNQGALRSTHRRPHRRRLFADRSDDGVRREPSQWRQQGRVGRHTASGRRSRHRGRGDRLDIPEHRRNRRDRAARAAADGRLFQERGRDGAGVARARGYRFGC